MNYWVALANRFFRHFSVVVFFARESYCRDFVAIEKLGFNLLVSVTESNNFHFFVAEFLLSLRLSWSRVVVASLSIEPKSIRVMSTATEENESICVDVKQIHNETKRRDFEFWHVDDEQFQVFLSFFNCRFETRKGNMSCQFLLLFIRVRFAFCSFQSQLVNAIPTVCWMQHRQLKDVNFDVCTTVFVVVRKRSLANNSPLQIQNDLLRLSRMTRNGMRRFHFWLKTGRTCARTKST